MKTETLTPVKRCLLCDVALPNARPRDVRCRSCETRHEAGVRLVRGLADATLETLARAYQTAATVHCDTAAELAERGRTVDLIDAIGTYRFGYKWTEPSQE